MDNADIKAALPGQTLRDRVVAGLQLRAFSGRKSFYLYYRTKGGTQRKPKIGDWPGLTLVKARLIGRRMLDTVAAGGDPQGEREADRVAPTVADMGRRYMIEHGDAKKSAASDRYLIGQYLTDTKFSRLTVAKLEYSDVRAWHAKISEATPTRANRALALLSKALNLAELWKWRPPQTNPCRGVVKNKERRRKRYMSVDEASKISAEMESRAARRPGAIAFLYLLIYSGARKGEIARARWQDLSGDIITLAEHKNDEDDSERIIHVPAQAMRHIATLPRTSGTICGTKDPRETWEAIRAAAGCPDLRMHDLRHSFASAALAAGLTLPQLGELLGHKSAQTTKGYAHLMEDIGRASAKATGDLIAGRLTGPRNRTT